MTPIKNCKPDEIFIPISVRDWGVGGKGLEKFGTQICIAISSLGHGCGTSPKHMTSAEREMRAALEVKLADQVIKVSAGDRAWPHVLPVSCALLSASGRSALGGMGVTWQRKGSGEPADVGVALGDGADGAHGGT